MNLDAYFRRIGYGGGAVPDLDTLQALHALHPLAIPFENLSAFTGEAVSLEPEALEHKLVRCRRGGYCFEHNLLFARVLEALGYTVRGLAARVLWNAAPGALPPRTHMLLAVQVDGATWLADVGFGGLTQTAPLRLEPGIVQSSPHEPFRLQRLNDADYCLEACVAGEWKPLYRFDLQEQQYADYVLANWYVATHPESRFVQQLIAARPDIGCRHALLNRDYVLHPAEGESRKRELDRAETLIELLWSEFGIEAAGLPGLEARLAALFERNPGAAGGP